MEAMGACFCRLFIAVCCFVIPRPSYQTPAQVATKREKHQKLEDYTFEGALNRAKEECSYMALVNDTVFRNRTLQMVKEKIAQKTADEFYRQREREKQKAKEYYAKLEEQSRRRVLAGGGPRWDPNIVPPTPFFPPPAPVPFSSPHKRSVGPPRRSQGSSAAFSEVSFTDHNNCSSRCLFARMEMVNSYGFPQESLMAKLIEDRILNRRVRLLKTKKVAACFRKMDEVAFDDSCIFSTKLFECLDLGEQSSWSGFR